MIGPKTKSQWMESKEKRIIISLFHKIFESPNVFMENFRVEKKWNHVCVILFLSNGYHHWNYQITEFVLNSILTIAKLYSPDLIDERANHVKI